MESTEKPTPASESKRTLETVNQEYTDLCVQLGNINHAIYMTFVEHKRLATLTDPILEKMQELTKEANRFKKQEPLQAVPDQTS